MSDGSGASRSGSDVWVFDGADCAGGLDCVCGAFSGEGDAVVSPTCATDSTVVTARCGQVEGSVPEAADAASTVRTASAPAMATASCIRPHRR
ncbi:MAG: hypothetical protein AUJ02_10795 [Chloroflexi bacterium 13_1_40CM_3_65_12]|nr:MAG: hypothetical protein AUH40_02890 [Chloroflexi bacterium 13_1_40CM_65_17]OLD23455.1 MAG: hypothetical protein AUJ02_10795 [Chloroflexi bacterium 13_1_40CM_3_65_12]